MYMRRIRKEITLAQDILEQVEEYCVKNKKPFSHLVEDLLRSFLKEKSFLNNENNFLSVENVCNKCGHVKLIITDCPCECHNEAYKDNNYDVSKLLGLD